jgi:hypothetical protein
MGARAVIIARGAFEIRVRFVIGTRRRSRRSRPVIATHRESVAAIEGATPIWPPPVITDALIAEYIAIAHAERRAAMGQMFLRLLAVFKRHSARSREGGDPEPSN